MRMYPAANAARPEPPRTMVYRRTQRCFSRFYGWDIRPRRSLSVASRIEPIQFLQIDAYHVVKCSVNKL
jgi:hypothetical protein